MCWSNRHLDKKNTDERHNARQKAVEIRFHMVPRSYLLVFLWSLGDGWTLATTKQETRSRTRTAISSILSSNEQHLALHRRVVICWQWRHIRDRMTFEPSGRRTYIYHCAGFGQRIRFTADIPSDNIRYPDTLVALKILLNASFGEQRTLYQWWKRLNGIIGRAAKLSLFRSPKSNTLRIYFCSTNVARHFISKLPPAGIQWIDSDADLSFKTNQNRGSADGYIYRNIALIMPRRTDKSIGDNRCRGNVMPCVTEGHLSGSFGILVRRCKKHYYTQVKYALLANLLLASA